MQKKEKSNSYTRESNNSTWTKTPWATVLQNKYSSQWRNTEEETVTPEGL